MTENLVRTPRRSRSRWALFNFTGPERTFIDDPDLLSRWRAQIGVKYFFQ
jgi:hypothetical protein